MSKIKDLPKNSRPREKAYRIGVENLSDSELLAIIIQSGTKQMSALELSNQLINIFNGLDKVLDSSSYLLMQVKGISKVKSLLILSIKELFNRYNQSKISNDEIVFNSILDIYNYVYLKINKLSEKIIVFYLNNKNVLLYEQVLSIGDESSAILNNKLILKTVLEKYAKKVIVVHNHPSGNPLPSLADINAYYDLFEALKYINVVLLDSIIIGNKKYYSIKNELEYKVLN